ncbi:beta-ketoacyl synthase N-terminal-like domain-containing protein [Streptomyces scopuliridis]|uniref:beta-ketoacyl synthase N-terminal-like domain-containing protein n=1 Tax=Streptomyces scopuliridis TaxID=452529 RepID=UPI0035DE2A20
MVSGELIAVVGRGCVLPGALDPDTFWHGVRAGRVSLTGQPPADVRFPVADLGAGGYVKGFDEAFREALTATALRDLVDPDAVSGELDGAGLHDLDPLVRWTAYAAGAAVLESGQARSLPRAGLVIGNLSYPSRGLVSYAHRVWLPGDHRDGTSRPVAADRFMSGLPAHVVARVLGLGLGGYAVDAACASALYAVKLACDRLVDGRADLMIAGGVNGADPAFVHDAFGALSATSPSGLCRPFHRLADGLLPAEGAAVVALMRLSHALTVDAPILGVIRGVGLSCDGRASGLLAPSADGQRRAMAAAYATAGVAPETVGLLECHATGTPLGDATEVESTSQIFSESCGLAVGSVKANVGHLLTAAGGAGLLKVLGALREGLLPPALAAADPLPALSGTPLRLPAEAEDWPGPRRAAVSAFGFGGTNAHIVVDGWSGDASAAVAPLPIPSPAPAPEPIAVVAVRVNAAVEDATQAVLGGADTATTRSTVELDVAGLCFPPADLAQAHAQQTLMLQTARDAVLGLSLPPDRTTVVVGMGCDPEVARPAVARRPGRAAAATKARHTSASVVGSMPNLVANRITAQLGWTGPGYTVSAEQASGLVGVGIAARALRADECDAALVGAVDLSAEPVHRAAAAALGLTGPPGDAAVAVVLRRLADARAAGEPVLAILSDEVDDTDASGTCPDVIVGNARTSTAPHVDPARWFGEPHAATGLLAFAVAVLAVAHRALPQPDGPATPLLDPPVAEVAINSLGGGHARVRARAGDPLPFHADAMRFPVVYSGQNREDLAAALAARRPSDTGPARLVLLAADQAEHDTRAEAALAWLAGRAGRPDGIVVRDRPVDGEIAFVFSGGSMAYPGMGRETFLAFPDLVDRVRARCGPLTGLAGWAFRADDPKPDNALEQIWGAAVLGQVHAEISRSVLGLRADAALGHSSGELSALAATGVWPDLSPLSGMAAVDPDAFARAAATELAAVREVWAGAGVGAGTWASYLVAAGADRIRVALAGEPTVHLMVVNAPDSCVIGGEAGGCARVLARLDGVTSLPIDYDMPAHVPELRAETDEWESAYRLPVDRDAGVRYYTCSTAAPVELTTDAVASALTAQQLGPIDFAATVERAWDDGVRVFVEHGPRGHCAGWIRRTLGTREHVVVSLDTPTGHIGDTLTRVAAELLAAGVPVDTATLASRFAGSTPSPSRPLRLTAHPPEVRAHTAPARPGPLTSLLATGQFRLLADAHRSWFAAHAQAHADFLTARRAGTRLLTQARSSVRPTVSSPLVNGHHPRFDLDDLLAHGSGPVSAVLGEDFADLDTYRHTVRMPSPPMLLCDRVIGIDAEPGTLDRGVIRSETDVRPDAWYIDPAGRMPVGVCGEAGQAILLLLSYLGVDRLARGERVYRVLGCDFTLHGPLPRPGDTLRYEVHLTGRETFGGIPLFTFHSTCRVGDEVRLTITNGQAGLFTDAELDSGRGLTWRPDDDVPPPGGVLDPPVVTTGYRSFTTDQVAAFAAGEPADCFGPGWEPTRSHVRTPRIPDGQGRFVREVPEFDPRGGPWGRGYLRAQLRVEPDEWYFASHFPGDPCMPGTLMSEGCFQAMAFYLAAAGFTVDRDGWRFEPVTGIPFTLRYRGQVLPSSKLIEYEVFVVELIAEPMPTLVADVVFTVDGVVASHGRRVALRLVPDWPLSHWRHSGPPTVQTTGTPVPLDRLAGLVGHTEKTPVAGASGFAFDYPALLGCAWGRPSESFGPPYAAFDSHRRVARLPGPPFHFMTRVTELSGSPWELRTGAVAVIEYDIPADVWFFEQNDHPVAPLAVVMEIALQASGWLAAYAGSALHSETDLLFRNLGGRATITGELWPGDGTVTTRTRLTEVAHDGRTIIEGFATECLVGGVTVVEVTTTFGFFPADAFADQTGIPYAPGEPRWRDRDSSRAVEPAPGPRSMLSMVERITGYWPDGGAAGLGRVRGESDVDPGAWFFKAHFFQDPVQPGSLGVQALCQLVQFHIAESGLAAGLHRPRFRPALPDVPLKWKYRGQVTPLTRTVTTEVEIVEVGADDAGPYIVAEGWLWADGIRIYHVERFGVGLTES